jgi:branched-chain amino acid transport system permease protein
MAHGAFAMLGGYITIAVMNQMKVPFEVAVIVAIVATAIISVPLETFLIRKVYGRNELDQALLTIGIAFVVIAGVNSVTGANISVIKLPYYLNGSIDLGFRSLPTDRLVVIVLGLVVTVALWLFVERSAFGVKLRAAVDNAAMAEAVKINTSRLYVISFALGAALAALGGIAGASLLPMEPTYALKYLVLFLAVVAVGGHGALFGSFLAAVILGIIDTATKYLAPEYSSIAFFATMLIVLAVRPQGLLGAKS